MFQLAHAEDISSVYLFKNQFLSLFLTYLQKKIKNFMTRTYII